MGKVLQYSGAILATGLALLFVGSTSDIQGIYGISQLFIVIGGIGVGYIYIRDYQKYYCASCGQFLGRGSPNGSCPRCGSNRHTTSDPGAKR